MTTPAFSDQAAAADALATSAPQLYASVGALKLVLDSTDAGTGTAAQLSDEQLEMAITAASDRVSLYANAEFTSPVPSLITSLTLDLAAWWATTYYLKQKEMPATHPVQLRYAEAMKVLDAARKGEVNLLGPGADDVPDTAARAAGGKVINRLPCIFTGQDSNTEVVNGVLTPARVSGPGRGLITMPPDGQTTEYW
jgi:phage gp36-like protein